MYIPFSPRPCPNTLITLAVFSVGATLLAGCGSGSRTLAVASSTPTPTPTATPSATPSPTPTATPTPNRSTLSNYVVGTSRDSDTRAFAATFTSQQLGGGGRTTTSAYTQQGGTLFSKGFTGKTTIATLATGQGVVTVSRQEKLDSERQITGYQYFTGDSSGDTEYGSDTLDSTTGQLSTSERFNPPVSYRYDLTPGQSQTIATQIVHTSYALGTGAVVSTSAATATFTFTFVGTESVTVPAGTFTTAQVTLDFSYPNYPTLTSSYGGRTTTDTAAGVGVVQTVTTLSGFTDSLTYSSTETDLLTGAAVGGVHYGS